MASKSAGYSNSNYINSRFVYAKNDDVSFSKRKNVGSGCESKRDGKFPLETIGTLALTSNRRSISFFKEVHHIL